MSMDYHATGVTGDRITGMTRRSGSVGLALLLLACSSPLTKARSSFDEARYPDAVAQYQALRPELPRLGRPERFEYALYRGLSHLALGDARAAHYWLTVAKRLSEQSPGLANRDEQGRLLAGWQSMGLMPGE
jgi:hypothetical protein